MTVHTLNEGIVQFKASIDDMIQIIETTEPDLLYKKPSEGEWSAMQIASHVIEAIRFWATDVEALLIVPGAKWGRNHEHVRRLAAVDEQVVASLTKESAIALLNGVKIDTEKVLNKVTEAHLKQIAPSYNPNFDRKPLFFIVDHLIIKHVEGHVEQMQRHLSKVQ